MSGLDYTSTDVLHNEIEKRICFVSRYVDLGESHMVDFFVADHWNTLIHPDVQEELLQLDEEDLYTINKKSFSISSPNSLCSPNIVIRNMKQYYEEAQDCNIMNSKICLTFDEIVQTLKNSEEKTECTDSCTSDESNDLTKLISTKEYMCAKKSHEVEMMSRIVNAITRRFMIQDILDVGSGKGYLSTYISLTYGLNVVGVDCSESTSTAADTRAKKYVKYWNSLLSNKVPQTQKNKCLKTGINFHPVTALINGQTDVNSLLLHKDNISSSGYQNSEIYKPVLLTGLHTCGDLCSTSLRSFIKQEEFKSLCVVGCCYHLLTVAESHMELSEDSEDVGFPMSNFLQTKRFSLGRNSRMLGLRAPERMQATNSEEIEAKSTRSLFFRAVLSVILEKEFDIDCRRKDIKVGKTYSKSHGFVDYVRRCLKKLKINDKEISDDKITLYLEAFKERRKTMLAYNFLRVIFGPVVEAVILLDKLLYLKEQNVTNSYLVKLFDPVKSPRCYALVAIKS